MESLWARQTFSEKDISCFEQEPSRGASSSHTRRIQGIGFHVSRSNLHEWLQEQPIDDVDGWKNWIKSIESKRHEDVFALVLSPRAEPEDSTDPFRDHSPLLRYLSMELTTFKLITERLSLHPALSILVDHGSPIISRITASYKRVYTFRLEHTLTHQTAMTITHFPEKVGSSGIIETTNAIVLGYDAEDEAELKKRLGYCKDAVFSPFALIKAFLCVEKSRRWKEVNTKITKFQSILQNYNLVPIDYERNVTSDAEDATRTQSQKSLNSADPKNLIGLYIEVCTLKNSLAAWASQLRFFSENIEDDEFGSASLSDISPREYLRCLMEEYSLKINKCDLVLQGASLAFQMETAHLSRVDTQIALRDGKQMKAIAVLTMIFLPATFVAFTADNFRQTLLAVPQFKGIEEILSVPVWSWYLIIFLPLTAVVLGSYFIWINCFRKGSVDHSLKMA